MLLLIDAGNTNIKICLFDDAVADILRLKTDKARGESSEALSVKLNDLAAMHLGDNPDGAVISSVVTDVTPLLVEAVSDTFGITPMVLNHKMETGINILLKNPEEVGADRIANAVAVNKLYSGNKIVIDIGSATTICVVTEEGGFRGGVIMPGLDMSACALSEQTSKLPDINLKLPSKILGENTSDAMLSGIIIGQAGAVERVLGGIVNETGMDYNIIMTGGRAELIAPLVGSINHVDPDLTFKGLKIVYELNS